MNVFYWLVCYCSANSVKWLITALMHVDDLFIITSKQIDLLHKDELVGSFSVYLSNSVICVLVLLAVSR